METKKLNVEISIKTIAFTFVALILFLYRSDILPILITVFFAFIIASGVLPIVNKLVAHRVNKTVAVLSVYIGLILIFVLLVLVVILPFVQGLKAFLTNLPNYIRDIQAYLNSVDNIQILAWTLDKAAIVSIETQVTSYLTDLSNNLQMITQSLSGLFSGFKSIFSGLFSFLTTIIMSIYIVLDHDFLVENYVKKKVGKKHVESVLKLITNLELKLGNWIVGQFLLCVIIGLLNLAVLLVFNIPFAVPLAIIAGIMEAVPNLGPIISCIPIVIFAFFAGGPLVALAVLFCCILIQQLENNLIVPKIMGNAVGVRPLFVMVGILLGFSLGGVVGALLVLPIITVLMAIYEFYIDLQKLKAKGIF